MTNIEVNLNTLVKFNCQRAKDENYHFLKKIENKSKQKKDQASISFEEF